MHKETILPEPEYLEEILDSFSKATGLHIEAVNNKGETFIIPGNARRCEFCHYVRSQGSGERKCQDSYRRASLEAAKWEEPYFFRCHAGLVIWAVPIVIKGVSFGSILCGQVLMWEPDEFFFQELKKHNPDIDNFEQLKDLAKRLEVVSPERSQATADTLFVVVNHLVKRNIYTMEQQAAHRLQQQQIRKELEERKKLPIPDIKDYDSYLKKERSFLRYIRLGDKTRADNNLRILLSYLFTKAAGDKITIKIRVIELATLVSRAAIEGGADAETVMAMLKRFNEAMEKIDKVEVYFLMIQDIVTEFLGNSFALADKKHLSLVKNARNYIMENYSKPITIDDVAANLFISSSYLSRLFRQELQCTVNDYLTRVRVEQAVELMKKPELSVERVSKAIGFKNQSYFAKVFRKYIGVTPLVYKNSLF